MTPARFDHEYEHHGNASYASFCQGPYAESVRYRNFMGWEQ
jgi:hypothetical protein